MKIALIGQSAFGEAVLRALSTAGGDEIVGVFCPTDREGRPPDPIKSAATGLGLPVFQHRRMRNRSAVEQFSSLSADLCVMAYVTDIVPMEIIEAPELGTIQYHPSLLPKHRGPSSINWPIIYGERETGLTIFWPDAGLDTGPILLQRRVDIDPDDTLGSLYFNKLFPMGVEAMAEAVNLVRQGKAPRIPQDESQATYEGWCAGDHGYVDWRKPTEEIYNLVRGTNPRPGAYTRYRGSKLKLFDCELRPGGKPGEPGVVAKVTSEGFKVPGNDGNFLMVKRVQPEGARKLPASEWAASVDLRPGEQLGP